MNPRRQAGRRGRQESSKTCEVKTVKLRWALRRPGPLASHTERTRKDETTGYGEFVCLLPPLSFGEALRLVNAWTTRCDQLVSLPGRRRALSVKNTRAIEFWSRRVMIFRSTFTRTEITCGTFSIRFRFHFALLTGIFLRKYVAPRDFLDKLLQTTPIISKCSLCYCV